MFAWQFTRALYLAGRHGRTRFISMQPHYNLLYREEEREMLPVCKSEGIGVIPSSPMALRRLTRDADEVSARQTSYLVGKNLSDATVQADREVIDAVARVAKARGVSRAQVALAWVLKNPAITSPIIGASKPHHLEDAVAALDLALTPDEIAA